MFLVEDQESRDGVQILEHCKLPNCQAFTLMEKEQVDRLYFMVVLYSLAGEWHRHGPCAPCIPSSTALLIWTLETAKTSRFPNLQLFLWVSMKLFSCCIGYKLHKMGTWGMHKYLKV